MSGVVWQAGFIPRYESGTGAILTKKDRSGAGFWPAQDLDTAIEANGCLRQEV